MKISTKGRYAIALMLDIAEHSDQGNVSIKDVAKRQGISLKYLEQIVNMLSKAGLLKSQRGIQGGYKMLRSPDKYTIGDILRVTEGSMAPIDGIGDGAIEEGLNMRDCPTIKFWKGFYETINDYIDGTTIADIMEEDAKLREYQGYYI